MRYVVTLLLLLWPAFSDAQVVKISRQVCGPVSCHFEVGSGVVVGKQPAAHGGFTYRILTVYHVCGNRWDAKVKQWVRRGHDYKMLAITPAGRFPAQIAAWNGDAWLMLLTIDVPAGLPEIGIWPIADSLPSAGDAVTIHGYSHTRNCEYGVRSLTLRSYGPKEFETTSAFEQGESGGPIVKDGKIVGLCEGYDARTNFGMGPSVVAIRWFLDLPAIGSRAQSGKPGAGVPMRPSVSDVAGGGLSVPVPPPPAEQPRVSVPPPGAVIPAPNPPAGGSAAQGDSGAGVDSSADGAGEPASPAAPVTAGNSADQYRDAPAYIPPVHDSPRADRNPKSSAGADSNATSGTLQPRNQTGAANVGKAVGFGLDVWSMLAGAGIVAGTGGIGGLALLAWRGLKAGRAVKSAVDHWHPRPTPVIQRPDIKLPPQSVNFVEIPMDYRRESVDWALAEAGKKYPGAIGTVEMIKSLINQHLQANGHGQETLHP